MVVIVFFACKTKNNNCNPKNVSDQTDISRCFKLRMHLSPSHVYHKDVFCVSYCAYTSHIYQIDVFSVVFQIISTLFTSI